MKKTNYKFNIYDELQTGDTETTTFGCRCNNPDICKNNGDKTCAFFNEQHICSTPSRAWKKIYLQKLEEKEKKVKKNDL